MYVEPCPVYRVRIALRVFLSSTSQVARDAICALILGAPPGKVYNQMRNVARRMSERF